MNDRFFELPKEKQMNLFHAGCSVFAHNVYRNASMSKVAVEAGISKSLIFYYFRNKQEYYFYIIDQVANELNAFLTEVMDQKESYDLFDKVIEIIQQKKIYFERLNLYYELSKKIYYERDKDIIDGLQQFKIKMMQPYKKLFKSIDKSRFKNKNDVSNCIKIIFYCSEGILSHYKIDGSMDWDLLINEFRDMIASLKQNYYKEELD